MVLLFISLLTIFTGTLLLAKFRKELQGKFFVFVSWFFIVVGFVLFAGFIAGAICRFSHHGGMCCHEMRHEMMMRGFHPGIRPGMHPGMHPGMPCCPGGMGKEMCPPGMGKGMFPPAPCCKPGDSAMKCCPRHMACDSAKMKVQKK